MFRVTEGAGNELKKSLSKRYSEADFPFIRLNLGTS